ncbi:cob(I)yrinic acid a,c-diamide adenosyltransferase [soil metagenome]
MRIYTARGDTGQTDLLGERVEKDDPRIDLIGSLDETTSTIGLGRAQAQVAGANARLKTVQRDLYQIMAELAFTDATRPDSVHFSAERTSWLEVEVDSLSESIQLPREFVLPGETVAGAALDVARTVTRRAEREAVALTRSGVVGNTEIVRYLNRLSSLLFMAARAEDLMNTEHIELAKERPS